MGQIKIFGDEMSVFFDNGAGDLPTNVKIIERKDKKPKSNSGDFIGHFTAKKKNSIHLAAYDCGNIPVHTFDIGRWFVYRKNDLNMIIEYQDDHIHA